MLVINILCILLWEEIWYSTQILALGFHLWLNIRKLYFYLKKIILIFIDKYYSNLKSHVSSNQKKLLKLTHCKKTHTKITGNLFDEYWATTENRRRGNARGICHSFSLPVLPPDLIPLHKYSIICLFGLFILLSLNALYFLLLNIDNLSFNFHDLLPLPQTECLSANSKLFEEEI